MANEVDHIELFRIEDPRGNLTFLESLKEVPFKINRVFWTYDVPGGQVRGGHAYRSNQEIIIALSGSFDVIVNDGENERCISLNRSYNGIFIPALTWRHMENFSTNAFALIIASEKYDESDYIRKIEEFKSQLHET